MPLFFVIHYFCYIEQTAVRHKGITLTKFDDDGDAGDVIKMKRSSLTIFVMWEVLLEKLKSVQILTISPPGTRTHAIHISGSNGPVSECPPA
jgi:hypothetical protein